MIFDQYLKGYIQYFLEGITPVPTISSIVVKKHPFPAQPSHSFSLFIASPGSKVAVLIPPTMLLAAVQSRLRYQEAVEALHRVQEEWGLTLGLEVSSSKSSCTSSREGSLGMKQGRALPEDYATTGSGAVAGGATGVRDEVRNIGILSLRWVVVTGNNCHGRVGCLHSHVWQDFTYSLYK